jgi:hypothetical protein
MARSYFFFITRQRTLPMWKSLLRLPSKIKSHQYQSFKNSCNSQRREMKLGRTLFCLPHRKMIMWHINGIQVGCSDYLNMLGHIQILLVKCHWLWAAFSQGPGGYQLTFSPHQGLCCLPASSYLTALSKSLNIFLG